MKILTKIKVWFSDHYHLLFKSAAVNHLRIQEILKNPDGTYQLTVKFGSYSELKNYQRKLRRMTVSLSSAVAMIVVAFIVAPYVMNPNRSSAATYQWVQTNWATLSANTTTHPSSNWNQYASKNSGISINGSSQPTLTQPTPATKGDVNFAGIAQAGTYANASNGNALTLKSLLNGTCQNDSQCKNDTNQVCFSNTCKLKVGLSCGQDSYCMTNYCSGTCQLAPVGTTCISNSQCATNYCSETCQLAPVGTYCTSGSTCQTGSCENNACSHWVKLGVCSKKRYDTVYSGTWSQADAKCRELGGRLPDLSESCLYAVTCSGSYWLSNVWDGSRHYTLVCGTGSSFDYANNGTNLNIVCLKD